MIVEQLQRRLRIEAGGRLVEDRDLGVLHQDLGEAEPLPHAAREGLDPLVGDIVQADVIERVRDLRLALVALEADQAAGVVHVLGRGQIVVEADRVGQIADPTLDLQRLAHRIVAQHPHLSVRDLGQAEHHQDGGGLAGAVRAEQPEDLALRHR